MKIRKRINQGTRNIADKLGMHKVGEKLTEEIDPVDALKAGAKVLGVAGGILLYTVLPSTAANLEAELMYGQDQDTDAESLTLDMKASGKIIAGLNFFARYRGTMGLGEENNLDSSFTYVKLFYPLAGGLSAVASAAMVPGAEVQPRAGVQHIGKYGKNFSTFIEVTRNLNENPATYIVGKATYARPIGDKWGIVIADELLMTIFDKGNPEDPGKITDINRFRLGAFYEAQKSRISAGLAADVNDIGNRHGRTVTPGAYVEFKSK
ncbi:hypothetical protein ACFL6I_17040 [candidate division KSB1 bacterium]